MVGSTGNNNEVQNLAGGLNLSVSPLQGETIDAQASLNVYYQQYKKYGAIHVRKRKERVTTTPIDSAVKEIVQFTIGNTRYNQVYGTNGKVFSLNLTTGVTGLIETLPGYSWQPQFTTMGGKCFRGVSDLSANVHNCDISSTGIVTYFSSYYPTKFQNGSVLQGISTISVDKAIYSEGTGSIKVTSVGLSGGFTPDTVTSSSFGVKFTPKHPNGSSYTIDMTNQLFLVDFEPSQFSAPNYTYESITVSTIFKSGTATSTVAKTTNSGEAFANGYFFSLSMDPSLGTQTAGFDIAAVDEIAVVVNFANACDLIPVFYIDNMRMLYKKYGLSYATDNSGWTRVIDGNAPSTPKYLTLFDGRLWVADDNNVMASTVGDGTDFTTDPISFGIDDQDGDKILSIEPSGKMLIIKKNNSLHRIKITGDATIPYRRESVYTNSGEPVAGVGTLNGRVNLQYSLNSGSLVYGAFEYSVFLGSNYNMYSLGQTGTVVPVGQKVNDFFKHLVDADAPYCFAVKDPNLEHLIWFYPEKTGEQYSSKQLVYCVKEQAWTQFSMYRITAAKNVMGASKPIILLGDSSGYIYKYSHQTTDTVATDYVDHVGATNSPISANWKSIYESYGNEGYNKLLNILQTHYGTHGVQLSASCPFKAKVVTDDGAYNEVTIQSNGTVPIANSVSPMKVYGKHMAVELTNTPGKPMDVYTYNANIIYGKDLK